MSFNDLERGIGSPASRGRGESSGRGGGLNGQSYGRSNSNRSNNRGAAAARGPLPLYHAPPSSSSSLSSHANDGYATGEQRSTDPEWKKLADRIGIQIFKLNSNVQGIDKLMELQTRKIRASRAARAEVADKDWMAQM